MDLGAAAIPHQGEGFVNLTTGLAGGKRVLDRLPHRTGMTIRAEAAATRVVQGVDATDKVTRADGVALGGL